MSFFAVGNQYKLPEQAWNWLLGSQVWGRARIGTIPSTCYGSFHRNSVGWPFPICQEATPCTTLGTPARMNRVHVEP